MYFHLLKIFFKTWSPWLSPTSNLRKALPGEASRSTLARCRRMVQWDFLKGIANGSLLLLSPCDVFKSSHFPKQQGMTFNISDPVLPSEAHFPHMWSACWSLRHTSFLNEISCAMFVVHLPAAPPAPALISLWSCPALLSCRSLPSEMLEGTNHKLSQIKSVRYD